MEKELISVIVPCFNEQEVLPMFYDTIVGIAAEMQQKHTQLDFEFLFINDGSRDGTLDKLRELALKDKRVRYISFSRNFGKEAGIYAGLSNAAGDYAVTLDADLQHPPQLIPQMYEYVSSGEYDCVGTRRVSRDGEPKLMSFFSRMFYKIVNSISHTEIVDGAQDYRFMTRQMVDAILEMKEYNRFSKGIFSWVGFKTKYIEVNNIERAAGTTTWSFRKLFLYSLEGIYAFSTAPLAISFYLGVFFCLAALALLIVFLACGCVSGTLAIIAAVCLVGGVQLVCTGISAQYLSKTYLEVKARPKYLVRETDEMYRRRCGKNECE